jgi:hypothetical protein
MLPCEVLSIYCSVCYGDCAHVQPNAYHEHLDYNIMPQNMYNSNLQVPNCSVTFVQVAVLVHWLHAGRTEISYHLSVSVNYCLVVRRNSFMSFSQTLLQGNS